MSENKLEHKIGGFAANLRRPIPSTMGMTTQFFGQNGEDADNITVLSLTQFLDLKVTINVYLIKDAVGFSFKNEETNKFPLIASFIGVINRPKPNKDGMTAMFFAENGADANATINLSKTEYLDALVFVDIRGVMASNKTNIYDDENQTEIIERHMFKLGQEENREYNKKVKYFTKINSYLHSEKTLVNEKIIDIVNNKEKYLYSDFIKTQKCVMKNCENHDVTISRYNDYDTSFDTYIPLCDRHKELVNDCIKIKDYTNIDGKGYYLELQNSIMLMKWVWEFFIINFSLSGKEEPNSYEIYQWFQENDLVKLLPVKFIQNINKYISSIT